MPITLRDLHTLDEFKRVVELERLIWGCSYEDVVPVPIFVITVKRGGVLIGAFDDSDEMVGFVYSLTGMKNGKPTQWSHMLGVLESYRNSGLGRILKLEQRRRSLDMGFDLMEWTFDPLQAMNAHLNFRKLGVISEEYEENIYGESTSVLHRGTPTDRLVAEWWLSSSRVKAYVDGHTPDEPEVAAGEPLVNVTRSRENWRSCESIDLARAEPRLWLEIPTGFTEMQATDPAMALHWRMATSSSTATRAAGGIS
jgi:predicted GNAT superfamily acetyltransferase